MVAIPRGARPHLGAGIDMIRSISISNFRCYRKLLVDDLGSLNVIVGDNGSGKTAFLEAMFMALGASTEIPVRFRAQRGMDGVLGGTARRIEQGLWADLFHNYDFLHPIGIKLTGSGPESRSLEIARGGSADSTLLPGSDLSQLVVSAPVRFTWIDADHGVHSVTPTVSAGGGLSLPETGEDLPNFHFVPAMSPVSSGENASRFSELSKANRHRKFVDVFIREYGWIKDLSVEVQTGSPVIFASVSGSEMKMPLVNVSAGINRLLTIMLAIASTKYPIVLVDEIENGIFHTHLSAMWRTLIALVDEFEGQLFVSTHSQECLRALGEVASKRSKDITLLRTERGNGVATVKRFAGKTLMAGIQYGQELR